MAPERIFDGARARELREQTNMTGKDLVRAIAKDSELRYDVNTLYNVELGYAQPSPALSLAWAAALHVPRTELLMDAPDDAAP